MISLTLVLFNDNCSIVSTIKWSWGSVVSTVTKLGARRPKNHYSLAGRYKGFFSTPKRPWGFWVSRDLLVGGRFLTAKRPKGAGDHSSHLVLRLLTRLTVLCLPYACMACDSI